MSEPQPAQPTLAPARVDVAPARATVAALLAEMQTSPMPSWSEAITAVLTRHVGELIAP
mgnify:CR=1 FL=1